MMRVTTVVIGWMLGAVLAGCATPASQGVGGSAPAASPAATAAAAAADGKAVVVDVREADEVMRGMAGPAMWMPTSLIKDGGAEWERFTASLSKETPVYLYCESGGRSDWAAGRLRALGFQATNIGGYADWVGAGGPVRTPAREDLEPGR